MHQPGRYERIDSKAVYLEIKFNNKLYCAHINRDTRIVGDTIQIGPLTSVDDFISTGRVFKKSYHYARPLSKILFIKLTEMTAFEKLERPYWTRVSMDSAVKAKNKDKEKTLLHRVKSWFSRLFRKNKDAAIKKDNGSINLERPKKDIELDE